MKIKLSLKLKIKQITHVTADSEDRRTQENSERPAQPQDSYQIKGL